MIMLPCFKTEKLCVFWNVTSELWQKLPVQNAILQQIMYLLKAMDQKDCL